MQDDTPNCWELFCGLFKKRNRFTQEEKPHYVGVPTVLEEPLLKIQSMPAQPSNKTPTNVPRFFSTNPDFEIINGKLVLLPYDAPDSTVHLTPEYRKYFWGNK